MHIGLMKVYERATGQSAKVTVEDDIKGKDYITALYAVHPCTCGSTSILLRETLASKRYIHCHNCKRETRSYPTWGEAVLEWNGEEA